MDDNEIRGKIERLLEEQRQFFMKQEEKLDQLRSLIECIREDPLLTKVEAIESLPLEMSIVTNWECNYHCSYCFAYKPKDKSEYRKYAANDWERILSSSIYKKYGKCRLILTGGEPLFYPDAVDLVIQLTKYHFVSLGTNLSVEKETLRKIASESNRENLSIAPSFHLEHAPIARFMDKMLLLKEYRIPVWASAVAHPRYLMEMTEIKETFGQNSLGISFFPYIGTYNGKTFPSEYSKEELAILEKLEGWHLGTKHKEEPSEKVELPKTRRVLCYAGVKFCFVQPTGEAIRCTPTYQRLGNIFDESFSLLQQPSPCPAEMCNCEVYWKYLIR